LVEEEGDIAAFKDFKDTGIAAEAAPSSASAPEPVAATPTPAAAASPQAASVSSGSKSPISPLARKTAIDKGIDVSAISGTGPGGRIIKADVDEFKGAAKATKAASPVMSMRKLSKSLRCFIQQCI
jgi:pyruvate dehydrogenase E2 component (dihydrolipoamide acetyltransferase)